MNEHPVYTADEFERESQHLEKLVWEAIVVEPGSSVLFCGYGPDGQYVKRALREGADVTIIEHRNDQINRFANLGGKVLRGSTSVIPAKENSFDLAVSFHYLHEIDPFFHAQVLSELARVARRIAVIEPAPPADPLGKRIAVLYSQAKRELGQFEYYQPLEYWKKLLQSVKAEVSQHVFAFSKVPPHEYLKDTISLLLDTMEVEDTPKEMLAELRAIASRSDTLILPPPRYVLVGAAVGELPVPRFTSRIPATEITAKPARLVASPPPRSVTALEGAGLSAAELAGAGYELPPVAAPSSPAATAMPPPEEPLPEPAPQPEPVVRRSFTSGPAPEATPVPGFSPGLPFGAPPPPDASPPAPFGMPFSVPENEGAPAFGVPPGQGQPDSNWAWEPPDTEAPPNP